MLLVLASLRNASAADLDPTRSLGIRLGIKGYHVGSSGIAAEGCLKQLGWRSKIQDPERLEAFPSI